jgi:hypothetical protein
MPDAATLYRSRAGDLESLYERDKKWRRRKKK